MRAQGGRRLTDPGHLTVKAHRARHRLDRPKLGAGVFLHHARGLNLRVPRQLGQGIDRRERNTATHKGLLPVRARSAGEQGANDGHQGIVVGSAIDIERIVGMRRQFGPCDGYAELLPQLVVTAGDVNPAVCSLKGFIGHVVRHRTGRSRRRLCVLRRPGPLQAPSLQGHGRVCQAHLDMRTLTAVVALQERGQDTGKCVLPSGEVDQGNIDTRRCRLARLRDAHHARKGLHHRVIAARMSQRAILAKGRNRAVNQPRVALTQPLMAQAQPIHHARAEVLDQDVAAIGQAPHDLQALRLFEVDHHAAFVAVDHQEQGSRPRPAGMKRRPVA